MANLLITGANGGIGRSLSRRLSAGHRVIRLVRTTARSPSTPMSDDASDDVHRGRGGDVIACDLVHARPDWPHATRRGGGADLDWIIHLATTYRVDDDLAMLDHLLDFAREHQVAHFLYVSSWVVHFPKRPLSATYLKAKRACEERVLASGLPNVHILRPSVVLGEGLAWSKTLKRLAPVWWLLPAAWTRSFVSIDSLGSSVERMIEGRTRTPVVTLLGERATLAERAREALRSAGGDRGVKRLDRLAALLFVISGIALSRAFGASWTAAVGAIVALFAAIRFGLAPILGSLSDYFAGFVVRCFEPDTERDVLALCHRDNRHVQIRGFDNARLYYRKPNDWRQTTIVLRRFDSVEWLDVDRDTVYARAGAHFGGLLRFLEARGRWLENYPNYHFISVGACIAAAVHGSNLEKPFLVDLVEEIRFYDRETDSVRTVRRGEADFRELVFPDPSSCQRIILGAALRTCPRRYYTLETRAVPVEALDLEGTGMPDRVDSHFEIRLNTPRSKHARLQTYRTEPPSTPSAGPGGGAPATAVLGIKADAIGRQWNRLQRNSATSGLSSTISRLFLNFEWFFEPSDFAAFWNEITKTEPRCPFYKLLVRYNGSSADFDTPYHGTISVDVTILKTKSNLRLAGELFRRYHPLEHLGKFSIQSDFREPRRDSEPFRRLFDSES